MPVRVSFSGSSTKFGNASSAIRWLASSLDSQAPTLSWKIDLGADERSR